ncbi:MAG: hypothetical protein Q7R76_00040 [Candidatus Woesearchaeota archaeon]|nr:hypothetical protein [Candidatus Woesearchaeota archaeon]
MVALPSSRDLSSLLDYFLDEIAFDNAPSQGEKLTTQQLELVVNQDDLTIHVLHKDGELQDAISYSPETRCEYGFTSDYLRQISAQAKGRAQWRTGDGVPVIAHKHGGINVPAVGFFKVTQEPDRILFTYLGFFVTETSTLTDGKVVTKKISFGHEPIQLPYTKSTVYPQ